MVEMIPMKSCKPVGFQRDGWVCGKAVKIQGLNIMVGDTIDVPLKVASTHFYWLLDENNVEISQYSNIQEMIQQDSVAAERKVGHKIERTRVNDSVDPIVSTAASLFDVINE